MTTKQLQRLNFHHLFYFYRVARLRSFTRAAAELRVSQPAISAQIRNLEATLGHQLLVRGVREVSLTEMGSRVLTYSEQIFRSGGELLASLRGEGVEALPLRIGVLDVVPKSITHRVIAAAIDSPGTPRIVCVEGSTDHLLGGLVAHELDLILTDRISSSGGPTRIYHHELGESPISFFAVPREAAVYRRSFPDCLDGAPMLLPTDLAAVRSLLDDWFRRKKLFPKIVGEFQDSALMKFFGQAGFGIFIAPTVVENTVIQDFDVSVIGRVPEIKERFFLMSIERTLTHPCAVRILENAHLLLHAKAAPVQRVRKKSRRTAGKTSSHSERKG